MDRRTFLRLAAAAGASCAIGTNRLLAAPNEKTALSGAASYVDGARRGLPPWFGQNRVQGFTGLRIQLVSDPLFLKSADPFKRMGAHVYTRCFKCGDEGAWWPSSVGTVAPEARTQNLAKEIIENARKEGLHLILYYHHMDDGAMAEQHPDWLCRNPNGKPIPSAKGQHLCFNSPFADFISTRLLELTGMGAEGFYLDEWHMPRSGCWCDNCRKLFRQETGHDLPAKMDINDPRWHELIDFNNRTIERTFVKWSDAIHAKNPEVAILISANLWAAMANRHLTNRLFRVAGSVKSEFSVPIRDYPTNVLFNPGPNMRPFEPDVKLALGYTMLRDAAEGRPPHIYCFLLRDEASTLFAMAGLLTHGCIACLHAFEKDLPLMMHRKAYELGDKISPFFSETVPLRWAAVHYSELGRDRYLSQLSQVMPMAGYPVYGAFAALLRARLPVGIVTDSLLEDGHLDGYKVLFLPVPGALTPKMAAAVSKFKAAGGVVVEQQPGWNWGDREGYQKASKAFMDAVGEEAKRAPVQVFGGPERMHATPFGDPGKNQLTISIANDFSWVKTGKGDGPQLYGAPPEGPPPPCQGVRIVLRGFTPPREVVEAVSGKALAAKTSDGGLEIQVPDFDFMSVVVVRFS